MRTSRRFLAAGEAVSPVIAVILMVAITVVLAATVFVVLQAFSPNAAAARLGFSPSEESDRLNVNTVPTSQAPFWSRYAVVFESCTQPGGADQENMIHYMGETVTDSDYYGEEALTNGAALNSPGTGTTCGAGLEQQISTSTTATVVSGDYLRFCVGPTSLTATSTQVKIHVKDRSANELIYTHTFADIAKCTA